MNSTEEKSSQVSSDRDVQSGKLNGILQVCLVIGVLAAGLLTNRILSSGSTAPQVRAGSSATPLVDIIKPLVRDVPIQLKETGTVQVRNSIELSPQVNGRVLFVSPTLLPGGQFKKDEVLFRLDDADYQASINRASADLAAAQADLQVEQVEASIARREWEMVNPGQPIPPNVAREPQRAKAEAAVQAAEAALVDARLDLNRVTFSLPFDGRVLSSSIEVGQNLVAGQSYGRAYDPQGIEVSVPINSTALSVLSPAVGRDALVRPQQSQFSQSDRSYPARVARANAEVDQQTRLARLTLEFDQSISLLPGEFVDVEISGPVVEGAYVFPESTIQENRTVWVVKDGLLASRRPELVYVEEGQMISLPFDSGDGVVSTLLNSPREGDAVLTAGNDTDADQ